MSLLVVGTIAFDSIETPSGRVTEELGGSATYFALAASRFAPVRMVGSVGADFPQERLSVFDGRDVCRDGIEYVAGGKTFRWSGRYQGDLNEAQTLETQLNVLATFDPKLPPAYQTSPFVFLANGAPRVQLAVLERTRPALSAGGRFVMADTMNLWIDVERPALLEVLRQVDAVILNDGEARMLTGERNLIRAGQKVLELGPKAVIVKKGEHGAFLFSTYVFHAIPAYPVSQVVDPTGAGDSFAGGLMGYLARTGRVSIANLKRGMVYGTIAASFTVSDFGTRALARATRDDFEVRMTEFAHFVS
jgi:sugar/nucleoside kinase (ribokinase family)